MKDLILDSKTNTVLSSYDRLSHTFISGYPSSGIATYLCKLIAQDTSAGTPCVVLDPYGDLKESTEKNIDEKSKKNIVHLKIGDTTQKLSLNIFKNKDLSSSDIAQAVIDLFYDLYDPARSSGVIGPRFEHAVRNAVITVLADENPNFHKLCKLFVDQEYVKSLLPMVKSESVKTYWLKQIEQTSDFHKSEVLDYIISKFGPFLSHEAIDMSVNGEDYFDLLELIRSGKTIICDLSSIVYDKQAYTILSTLLLYSIEGAVLKKPKDLKVSVYLDEVQILNFAKLQKLAIFGKMYSTALIFATSRAKKLGELEYECSRFGTKISFRQMNQDAQILERMFVTDSNHAVHLQTLKRFHVYVQTLKDSEVQPAKIINT